MIRGSRRALKSWGSGVVTPDVFGPGSGPHAAGCTAIVVLERASHLETVLASDLVGEHTRVFAPGVADSGPGPLVMGYEGSLSEAGGEVQVGPTFFLQTQDYGTSEYLSLIGATLVRVVDDNDLAIFAADADRARETGVFPEFLTHHLLQLCDLPSLGGRRGDDGPTLRLYVDATGQISLSPSGLRIGELGDELALLEKEWDNLQGDAEHGCAVGLGRAVSAEARTETLRARPWLARYHDAVAALQHLSAREIGLAGETRVSGFGGRLDPSLDDVTAAADTLREGAPTLLWTAESAYLHNPADDRLFEIDHAAGRVVEGLLVHGCAEAVARAGSRSQVSAVRDFFERAGVPVCG
jgi:hypothetical protein